MKKFCFYGVVACICAGFVFSGCKKDNDGGSSGSSSSIKASVVNGDKYNSEVDVVKAVTDVDEFVLAEGKYSKGGFSISLPKSVGDKYLESFADAEGLDEMPDFIKVSNKDAKVGSVEFRGYKAGKYVDNDFSYAKIDINALTGKVTITVGMYLYADRDVNITGSGSEFDEEEGVTVTMSYNMSLKKGWNIMYGALSISSTSMTASATTTNPGGLKWYYGDEDIWEVGSKSLQVQPESFAKFPTYKSKIFSGFKF